jgi:phosphosulfolactate synthase
MILSLPKRTKPKRLTGLTSILDKGMGKEYLKDYLLNCAQYIDVAKLAWGTAVISNIVKEKIKIYKEFGIEVSSGGTLFELFYLQSKIDEYIDYLKHLDIDIAEISDGVVEIPRKEKLKFIKKLKKYFKVYSEVGSKDVEFVTPPAKWAQWIKEELGAGSDYVILEGRETGTVGLFRETGEIRMGLVNEIIESGISPDVLIFETPRRHQQVWFIQRFGANVNLANIPIEEVISLETLRLGLRADTLKYFHNK